MDELNSNIKGSISNLAYNDYDYKNISLKGDVSNYNFNGDVNVKDENVELNFKGEIDFSRKIKELNFFNKIKNANLQALNFTKKYSLSILNSNFNIDLKASSFNDVTGDVKIKNWVI